MQREFTDDLCGLCVQLCGRVKAIQGGGYSLLWLRFNKWLLVIYLAIGITLRGLAELVTFFFRAADAAGQDYSSINAKTLKMSTKDIPSWSGGAVVFLEGKSLMGPPLRGCLNILMSTWGMV